MLVLLLELQQDEDEALLHYLTNKPRDRRFWVREIFKERKLKGEFSSLVMQAKMSDEEMLFQMFRMTPTKFEELLQYVAPHILRDSTRREAIQPEERLCVTLRYLVTGDAFNTIGTSYRMSGTTVGRIVKETCSVLWDVLLENGYLSVPQSTDEWKKLATDFETRWNFPNCVGAIDGKHVAIQCPPRGGSIYFNYKKFHSLVLMAVVNAKYEFVMVDIGDYGRLSDASVFSSSCVGHAINTGTLNLPPPRPLSSSSLKYPYVFVGDDAFPLKPCLLKPYPGHNLRIEQRVTNYRVSRARRTSENVFGIATARFRVFRKPICANIDTATAVTKAVVALHNFLMKSKNLDGFSRYCPPDFLDRDISGKVQEGSWRTENFNQTLSNVRYMGSNNYSRLSKMVRDNFCNYFNSNEGSVPWQLPSVQSTSNSFDDI